MENTDDQPTLSENPTDEKGGGQVRSYECTFCKRGFSNAQALGGHMNIHRKDKAKLKQSSKETHKVSPPNWPSMDEAKVVDIKQLPLFAERSWAEAQNLEGHFLREITMEKALSPAQGLSPELDLELRLGPDPPDSSAAKGTKKFF